MQTHATVVTHLYVIRRAPSSPNKLYNVDLQQPHPTGTDGRPISTSFISRRMQPAALASGEPPVVSPEHEQARAETFQRILKSSPRRETPVKIFAVVTHLLFSQSASPRTHRSQ